MNSRKLLRKALDNPRGLRFSEAIKLAEAFGVRCDRVAGSHHIFKRAGMAKPYQVKQLLKLAEQRNLSLAD